MRLTAFGNLEELLFAVVYAQSNRFPVDHLLCLNYTLGHEPQGIGPQHCTGGNRNGTSAVGLS